MVYLLLLADWHLFVENCPWDYKMLQYRGSPRPVTPPRTLLRC